MMIVSCRLYQQKHNNWMSLVKTILAINEDNTIFVLVRYASTNGHDLSVLNTNSMDTRVSQF